VLIVAAAGNQGTIGGTVITGHPWVIPVVAWKPVNESNLGHYDWEAPFAGAGRPDYQPWRGRPTAHTKRDKCRGAFCDGCSRLGLVGISRRDRGPNALGLHAYRGRSTVTPHCSMHGRRTKSF
jgi:hypothetical protein